VIRGKPVVIDDPIDVGDRDVVAKERTRAPGAERLRRDDVGRNADGLARERRRESAVADIGAERDLLDRKSVV
jgi:hypothetical protein